MVLEKLKRLADQAAAVQAPVPQMFGTLRRESWVRFFSDTVILACHMDDDLPIQDLEGARELRKVILDTLALTWVTISAATAMAAAVDIDDPPLAYRGAISFGEFAAERDFVVGPAVDEAAEAEKLARGAFVWYCPTAMDCVSRAHANEYYGMLGPTFEHLPLVLNYPVPLSGGDTILSHVINPLRSGTGQRDRLMQRTLMSFSSPRLDVQVKRQNTEAFLRRADAEATAAMAQLVGLLSSTPKV